MRRLLIGAWRWLSSADDAEADVSARLRDGRARQQCLQQQNADDDRRPHARKRHSLFLDWIHRGLWVPMKTLETR